MELDDYPIGPERDTQSPAPRGGPGGRAWAIAAVCLLVAAAAATFYLTRRSGDSDAAPATGAGAEARDSAPAARGALGPAVEPRDLPPLDLTDPVVRELLSGLSSTPELAAWLATDGLVRSIVVSVDNVARGTTPAPHLRTLAPRRPFTAAPKGQDFVIDTRSYQRYDGIADTVAALDAARLARAYSTLRPRLQDAYAELGNPDRDFDAAVERAIARLLSTPVVERDVNVQPAPVLYQFVDARLETLSPAQKQLLRMGPRNMRLVQDKLRELAGELGLPAM